MHVYRQGSQLLFLESLSSTLGGYSSLKVTTCGASMVPTPPTSSPAPPLASFFLMLLSLGIAGTSSPHTHICDLHRPCITNSNDLWSHLWWNSDECCYCPAEVLEGSAAPTSSSYISYTSNLLHLYHILPLYISQQANIQFVVYVLTVGWLA